MDLCPIGNCVFKHQCDSFICFYNACFLVPEAFDVIVDLESRIFVSDLLGSKNFSFELVLDYSVEIRLIRPG